MKIKEQSHTIQTLTAEKEKLQEENKGLMDNVETLKTEREELLLAAEHLRTVENQSAHQQALLAQMKSRLEEQEFSEDKELTEKQATIEDLHLRLKANVSSIQQLNEQLNSLNRENIRIRSELERERSANQTLHLELESKEEIISNLKSKFDTNRFPPQSIPNNGSPPRAGLSDSAYASVLERGLSRSLLKDTVKGSLIGSENTADPDALDKSYWIQRVGELSVQLQQSSDYWSDKVRELSAQIERNRTPSPHK